jgi:hypothetical protein
MKEGREEGKEEGKEEQGCTSDEKLAENDIRYG